MHKKNSKAALTQNILMFSKTAPSGTTSDITGDLDDNNFMKSVSSKKIHASTKLYKTSKMPKPWEYDPGNLREIRRESPVGAVYAEDLEHEKARLRA